MNSVQGFGDGWNMKCQTQRSLSRTAGRARVSTISPANIINNYIYNKYLIINMFPPPTCYAASNWDPTRCQDEAPCAPFRLS